MTLTVESKPGVALTFVEVPADAHEFAVGNSQISYWYNDRIYHSVKVVDVPYGNYSFISTTKDITEEQAAELVEIWVNRPKEFLFNIMSQQGLDPDKKVYAILKQ